MSDDLVFEVRPVPEPLQSVIYGHHHLITIGNPPRIRAVVPDLHDALRICDLLNEHGDLDVPNYIDIQGDST